MASKSGGTAEPGTSLARLAADQNFRHVALGRPDVGGRCPALTNFGLMPASLMGLDAGALLDRSEPMVRACAASVPPDANAGVALGIFLGTAAAQGRDKLTFARRGRLLCRERIPFDVARPRRGTSGAAAKRAQALGDYQVLLERGRRLLRVEIGTDTLAGLRQLRKLFEAAFTGQPG